MVANPLHNDVLALKREPARPAEVPERRPRSGRGLLSGELGRRAAGGVAARRSGRTGFGAIEAAPAFRRRRGGLMGEAWSETCAWQGAWAVLQWAAES